MVDTGGTATMEDTLRRSSSAENWAEVAAELRFQLDQGPVANAGCVRLAGGLVAAGRGRVDCRA